MSIYFCINVSAYVCTYILKIYLRHEQQHRSERLTPLWMFRCVHIYMYVWMCTHIHVCLDVYTYTCLFGCVHIYSKVYMYV